MIEKSNTQKAQFDNYDINLHCLFDVVLTMRRRQYVENKMPTRCNRGFYFIFIL